MDQNLPIVFFGYEASRICCKTPKILQICNSQLSVIMEDIKPTEDSKPKVDGSGGDDESINLSVADGAGGTPVQFKIKKTTPLRKLMAAYCKRQGISKEDVRFTFDGARLHEQDVPKARGLEDGDQIEVFQMQQGGESHQPCVQLH